MAGSQPLDFKSSLLDSLLADLPSGSAVLDMGCGDARNWVRPLGERPDLLYTGIEQHAPSLERARALLPRRAGISLVDGFGEQASTLAGRFDLVISLSVLEHVKYLERFLAIGCTAARPGARIVHRYDLGHDLHGPLRERLHVWLCRRLGFICPASRYTTHPRSPEIVRILEQHGASVTAIEHSQHHGLKQLMNRLDRGHPDASALAARLIALDADLAASAALPLDPALRDHVFPAITIRALKRG